MHIKSQPTKTHVQAFQIHKPSAFPFTFSFHLDQQRDPASVAQVYSTIKFTLKPKP